MARFGVHTIAAWSLPFHRKIYRFSVASRNSRWIKMVKWLHQQVNWHGKYYTKINIKIYVIKRERHQLRWATWSIKMTVSFSVWLPICGFDHHDYPIIKTHFITHMQLLCHIDRFFLLCHRTHFNQLNNKNSNAIPKRDDWVPKSREQCQQFKLARVNLHWAFAIKTLFMRNHLIITNFLSPRFCHRHRWRLLFLIKIQRMLCTMHVTGYF